MENAEKAVMIAFAVFVLVIALSLSMFMFAKVTATSEQLALYSDSTLFYDNVELTKLCEACNEENSYNSKLCKNCKTVFPDIVDSENEDLKNGTTRIVGTDTIIPTLYRYYKENFCVKIYGEEDASGKPELIQIFDVNLEGKVHGAAGDTLAESGSTTTHIQNNAYNKVYNDKNKKFCLFGAPWLGSTESVKTRIDYFVEGKAGYINNTYVDYRSDKFNDFYEARIAKKQFKERFISYSYSGQTMTTEDGDILVTGEKSKDKIVIIYTLIK